MAGPLAAAALLPFSIYQHTSPTDPTQLQHGYAGPPTALLPFSIHQHTSPTDPHSYNTAMLDHPQHYCRSASTSTQHPPTHTATTRLCWTTHSTTAVQHLPAHSTHRPHTATTRLCWTTHSTTAVQLSTSTQHQQMCSHGHAAALHATRLASADLQCVKPG